MAGVRTGLDRQMALFGIKALNPVGDLKREMGLAAKKSGLSRQEICDRMNILIQVEGLRTKGKDGLVTLAMLDKWLAPEALESIIPLKLLPVFCRVVGSLAPLQALAGPVGGMVIGGLEVVLLEMARAYPGPLPHEPE